MQDSTLRFNNFFTQELPADNDHSNTIRQVANACFSWVTPTHCSQPTLLAHSAEVAKMLAIQVDGSWFSDVFAGNKTLAGMQPYAMRYGGHQFGNWAGQLGDGRAINLGQLNTADQQHFTLQLKGAGKTPYSRHADGRAVLRSSLREFLCSEAMHHLGIPTTRALSLVLSGDQVTRDIMYNGNVAAEPGAIVCRVAPTFLRFGSFQLHTAMGEQLLLQQLADFTIAHYFPTVDATSAEKYIQWFEIVAQQTAKTVAHWQRVGFVHGVLNTDNMSITGETIDYGPYGWLEPYQPNWTPNTTDREYQRYGFANQPYISHWNLGMFANSLVPLLRASSSLVEQLQQKLAGYPGVYQHHWQHTAASKLGLARWQSASDEKLYSTLEQLLEQCQFDYVLFFRQLGNALSLPNDQALQLLAATSYTALSTAQLDACRDWLRRYRARLGRQTAQQITAQITVMNTVNPKYVLRNYLAHQAIEAAHAGDYSVLHTLQALLRTPYDEQPTMERFAKKRPDWAENKVGCSKLSCSS